MRGFLWIVGAVCGLLVLLPASLHVVAQEPETGRQPYVRPDTTRFVELSGRSALHLRGACLDDGVTCVGDVTRDDGAFFIEAPVTRGHVVVVWTPVNESLRVLRVSVEGIVVEGESPLRMDVSGLSAGDHLVRLEPARRTVGVHDQEAEWVATLLVDAPFDSVEAHGISIHKTLAGCILGTCAPKTEATSDPLVVPWTARGELVATWDPGEGPMRLHIPGTGFVAEGETPLALPLDGLAAGEWTVEVTPPGLALPLSQVEVRWVATLARA